MSARLMRPVLAAPFNRLPLSLIGRLLVAALVACVLAIGGQARAGLNANGKIAYDGGSASPPTIRVVNPDGTGDRFLVVGVQPSWSPDGLRLAYAKPDRDFGNVIAVSDQRI